MSQGTTDQGFFGTAPQDATSAITDTVSSATNKINIGFKDLMASDSIVAKLAFILLVVFLFIVALRIGISALSYFLSTNTTKFFTGMVDAKNAQVYSQDPSANPYLPVTRSSNEGDGVEFTWSTWIYINGLQYLEDKYKTVFFKGNNSPGEDGINTPNNGPGLYITPHRNALVVVMSTFTEINKEIVIPDIPIGKWVNVMISCVGQTLNVYINGTITRSINLGGVPKQNDGDVYVGSNGGFDGYVSNLWYYNRALSIGEISRIVSTGPNTTMIGNTNSALNDKSADYLSLRWFVRG